MVLSSRATANREERDVAVAAVACTHLDNRIVDAQSSRMVQGAGKFKDPVQFSSVQFS